MASDRHPPDPGPMVRPNILAVMEALGDVTFPISKRDLLEQVEEGATVVVDGRNVDLHALIKDIHDDFFDDEAELETALERQYMSRDEGPPLAGTEGGVLPTGPQGSWQSRHGPGDTASASSYLEPPE